MSDKYKLEGHQAVKCESLIEWAEWYETADRQVAKGAVGNVRISTVFLGLDHNFGEGEPILFETMVFGGHMDGRMDRYRTWDEAENGHLAMAFRVERTSMSESKAPCPYCERPVGGVHRESCRRSVASVGRVASAMGLLGRVKWLWNSANGTYRRPAPPCESQ